MSTVTLSKPHCAITSAENPEGIASQAFTTALPDAQISLTLFATSYSFPLFKRTVIATEQSLHGPLDAHLADADFAGGTHYRRPGIVRQGYTVLGTIGAHFPFGIAGDQHAIDAGDRLGRPDKVGIARDFAVEEIRGVDHLGIDVERQHAIGKAPVRCGGARAGQGAAEQLADESEPRTLVLAEGADRATTLGVVARSFRGMGSVQHRRVFTQRTVAVDQRALG